MAAQPQTALDDSTLNAQRVRFERDRFDHLMMQYRDKWYDNVQPIRAFAISAPNRFISIRDVDGEEVGVIEDIDDLDDNSRSVLSSELERRYFVPRILAINDIVSAPGLVKFDVETDRGHREFEIREKDDVRYISGSRYRIRDIDGNVYELRNLHSLDTKSQELIEQMM